MSLKSQKREKLIAFIFVNKTQYSSTLNNKIYHSNKQAPLPFFHSDFNTQSCYVLVHSVDKIHLLVVTVELIWLLFLNIFFFNFVPTSNKCVSFARFRRSYVNRTAVVPTKYCQSYNAFLLDAFLHMFVPNDV